MGLVIAAGLDIGTLFTLYVLPAFYTFLAKDRAAEAASGTEGTATQRA